MSETPRPQGTVGVARAWHPPLREGRAETHTAGVSGLGFPHRSDSRPPHTPRGARRTGQDGRPGTIPPVPGRPYEFSRPLPGRPFGRFSARALLLFLCGVLFALTTWQVAADGPLRGVDERLGRDIDGAQGTGAAQFLADLGSMQAALPVLALSLVATALLLKSRPVPGRWWLPPLLGLLAAAAVPATVAPLKALIGRPGPPAMDNAENFYPSGHTATAVIAYGCAALLLGPLLLPTARRVLYAVSVLLVLGTSVGLVLCGYHWPLDVLGSWFLGGILLCLVAAAAQLTGGGALPEPDPSWPAGRQERGPGSTGVFGAVVEEGGTAGDATCFMTDEDDEDNEPGTTVSGTGVVWHVRTTPTKTTDVGTDEDGTPDNDRGAAPDNDADGAPDDDVDRDADDDVDGARDEARDSTQAGSRGSARNDSRDGDPDGHRTN